MDTVSNNTHAMISWIKFIFPPILYHKRIEIILFIDFSFLGDHYIHIKIDVPKKLDNKQKAILQAYAEMESDTPGTVKGFTYKKDGSRVVMEDTDGFVADIKEVFDETQDQKPENELDANGAKE